MPARSAPSFDWSFRLHGGDGGGVGRGGLGRLLYPLSHKGFSARHPSTHWRLIGAGKNCEREPAAGRSDVYVGFDSARKEGDVTSEKGENVHEVSMKKILWLMLALGLLVAACGGTDDEPAGSTTTTARATTFVSRTDLFEQPGSVFVPSTSSHPLVLRAIDFDAGMVEIANTGSEDL